MFFTVRNLVYIYGAHTGIVRVRLHSTDCFIPSSRNERRRTITGDLPSCFERRRNVSRVKYVRAKMLHNSIA